MPRGVVLAFFLGVATAVAGSITWEHLLVGTAHAQNEQMTSRQQYLLVLAIGNALSSLAVDSERTAGSLNDVSDRVKALETRLRRAEKRVEELERMR